MFDHIGFAVKDLAKARRFYTACAGALRLAVIGNGEQSFLVARDARTPMPFIWIGTARPNFWAASHQVSASPMHLCFQADSREAVNAFHAAALDAGGKDNGAPGPRGEAGYYAAYVIDPDGNNVEAGLRE
ncbi:MULTISPECIES: VOC family protein [Rhodomicrobium]|uniref:VOC family protein n=1 Tax=Rhodomicrobium TaxID=1068 RepID=UPI000B4BF4EB|nr:MULTISPECIES: VOC family protein [Rhodomicrobium]